MNMLFKFYEHIDIKIKHAINLCSILMQTYIEQIYFEVVKVPNDIEQRTVGQMKVTDLSLCASSLLSSPSSPFSLFMFIV